jgi:hypothetical protein
MPPGRPFRVYPVAATPAPLEGRDDKLPGGGLIGSKPPSATGPSGSEGSDCASVSSAVLSVPGISLPRRAARRRIPLAAFGLKEYPDRCGPVSKTSGNEDATTALGNAEKLSVQNSVGDPIPAFSHRPEDGTHGSSVESHAAARAGTALGNVGDVGNEGALSVSLFPSSAPNSASVDQAGFVSGA